MLFKCREDSLKILKKNWNPRASSTGQGKETFRSDRCRQSIFAEHLIIFFLSIDRDGSARD